MIQPYSPALLKQHFPSQRPATPGVFELAIACCGGTSTGPYVAGVLDFLWEAFEAWRKAAAAGTAPTHQVRIRNMVGASAGGLSLGLAALATIKQFPHVYDDRLWAKYRSADPSLPAEQPKGDNPHYRAWVLEITLDRLLSHPEEVEGGQIYLFHSAPTEICDTVLALVDKAPWAAGRDFVAHPLELRATIGNLQGVPYALDFNHVGGGAAVTTSYFEMHRDNIAFAVETAPVGGVPELAPGGAAPLGPAPDAHDLGTQDFGPPQAPAASKARTLFRAAMVSTSAIPLVFRVTEVPQDPTVYQWRTAYWDVARGKAVVDQPVFPTPPANPINYAATDGGLFDNRPFNVAHARLAGARGQNPQGALDACRAVILVDPLADDTTPPPANPVYADLFSVVARLVLSPVLQDRLDTLDLAQIKDETIFSRFMIAPSRQHPDRPVDWAPSKSLLAAPLNAFLGFGAEAYREHDFLLGRRNAQQFLRRHLALPQAHPLFQGTTGWTVEDGFVDGGIAYYPLVPLRGRAADEQPVPAWNWQAMTAGDVDRYVAAAGRRADAIFHNLKTAATASQSPFGQLAGALVRLYLNLGWALGARSRILGAFRQALTDAEASLDPARKDRN